jgi:hypothetical protein
MVKPTIIKVNCWVCQQEGLVTKCCSCIDYYKNRGRLCCDKCNNPTELTKCPECKGDGKTELPNAETEVIDLDEEI